VLGPPRESGKTGPKKRPGPAQKPTAAKPNSKDYPLSWPCSSEVPTLAGVLVGTRPNARAVEHAKLGSRR